MGGDFPVCAKCGHTRYKVTNSVRICAACDYPEPVGRQEGEPGADEVAFDQRGYHELVARHARAKFLKGDYRGAVDECYKWLEKEVRRRSGLTHTGKRLMTEALGAAGPLKIRLPRLMAQTQKDATEGLMHLCAGVSLNVRNPMSHETDEDLAMTRAETLDRLTVLSHIFGQLDRTGRRRRTRRAQPKGGGRARQGTVPKKREAGKPTGGKAPDPQARSKGAVNELTVVPDSVEVGETVSVTVIGVGVGAWHARVSSEEDKTKSVPARLDAFARRDALEGGRSRSSFSVTTIGYEPGVYRVSVFAGKNMDAGDMRIAKFTVTHPMPIAISMGWPGYRNPAHRGSRYGRP